MRFVDPDSFHKLLQDVVDEYPGSMGELSQQIGTTRDKLSSWVNGTNHDPEVWHPRAYIPAVFLARLVMVTGRDDLALEFAIMMNKGCFTPPTPSHSDELSVFDLLDNRYAQTTNLSQTLQRAWLDKKITKQELPGIIQAAMKDQAASQEIVAWAQAMTEGGDDKQ
jgi:hypothetical protein